MPNAYGAEWTKTRSKLANTIKADPDADVTDLRRQLRAERLGDFIRRTVEAAPPLTTEQRQQLADLLRPATGAPTTGGGADG